MLRKILLTVAAALMVVGFGISSGQAAPLAPAAKTEIGSNVVQVQHRHHSHRRHHGHRHHYHRHHRHVRPRVIVVPRVHHHRHHHRPHRMYKRF